MVGKRAKFDDETWAAIEAVASESERSFQEVADEAFADFLKKYKQPVGLRAAGRAPSLLGAEAVCRGTSGEA